jgi:hypothetical protein
MTDRSFDPTDRLFPSADLRRLFPEQPMARPAGLVIDLRDVAQRDPSSDEDNDDHPLLASGDVLSTRALARQIRKLETQHILATGLMHDLDDLFQIATSALRLTALRLEQGRSADALRLIAKAETALQRGAAIVERLAMLPEPPQS